MTNPKELLNKSDEEIRKIVTSQKMEFPKNWGKVRPVTIAILCCFILSGVVYFAVINGVGEVSEGAQTAITSVAILFSIALLAALCTDKSKKERRAKEIYQSERTRIDEERERLRAEQEEQRLQEEARLAEALRQEQLERERKEREEQELFDRLVAEKKEKLKEQRSHD